MFNPDLQIGAPFLVRASTIATTSAYVNGTAFSMNTHNAIGIEVNYARGTETSLEIRLQVSNDDGVTWVQESAESVSGGTITKSLAERSYSATGIYSELIQPVRAKLVRLAAKTTTATTSTGSCSLRTYPLYV